MIQVFNGTRRGIGGGDKQVYLKLEFEFKKHIHHFKGAKLHVFMCLCLHADVHGFCYPSYTTLQELTGYSRDAVRIALNELCEEKIEGHLVLMRWREKNKKGKGIGSNRYRIFPSPEEIASIEDDQPDPSEPDEDYAETLADMGDEQPDHTPAESQAENKPSQGRPKTSLDARQIIGPPARPKIGPELEPVFNKNQLEQDPPTGGAKAPGPEETVAEKFRRLHGELEQTKNRTAKLMEIYALCYGDSNLPTFDKLGAVGKRLGAGRLADLLWQNTTRPPTGDVLDYIVACERNRKKGSTNGNGRKKSTTGANTDAGQGYTQPASQTPADEAARIRAALGLVSPLASD